jgi:hypothetical protein
VLFASLAAAACGGAFFAMQCDLLFLSRTWHRGATNAPCQLPKLAEAPAHFLGWHAPLRACDRWVAGVSGDMSHQQHIAWCVAAHLQVLGALRGSAKRALLGSVPCLPAKASRPCFTGRPGSAWLLVPMGGRYSTPPLLTRVPQKTRPWPGSFGLPNGLGTTESGT